ncbi:ABC transporter permease [Sediminibacterium ginsengisoli]|uniref:Putative ABC transport system permease protein n=1 Tax=Sediminibacterium ginsengisoli TaxID=413434 RepID=A0A1T4N9L0_9BACT|nr:ABC transporter permease [Sediminibacterium ginsengisoli]SJZ75747.1 putative ABC transport system permease protein [Sediminibacterium ginsengisoli]
MTTLDSLSLAWRTVRSNKLRTGITVAIIAFGIMALIGIITAIEAMNQSLKESFSSMGANAFNIRFKESRVRIGGGNTEVKKTVRGRKAKKSNLGKPIRKEDAEFFKNNYHFPGAMVSIYRRGPGAQEIHYEEKKTNPQINLWGGDENYLQVNGYTVQAGRNLNSLDVQSGRNVCLIGSNVASTLFGERPERAVDKIIRIGSMPYRVVGLLKSKGSSAMMRQDDVIITSYTNIRRFENITPSYMVGVMVGNVNELEAATDEATSVFRAVRKLEPMEEENFVIERSDKFAEMFIGFLSSITGAASAIGLITLIGAAIGLMNIMLVAVNERTKEVGLIKAIGGKSSNVRQQFLFESMIISLLGALFGIILGVLVGNIFGIILKTGFIVPWAWVIIGIVICSVVGLAAGIYPAMKAARLNPIVALRYE